MMKRNKKMTVVLRLVLYAIVGLLIGTGLYTVLIKNLVGDSLPMPLGYGTAVVLSGSMEPELSVDDVVVIRKTQEVAVNDIVVYQKDGALIIHRVKAIDGDNIITKGDANNTEDDPIPRSAVKGRLAFAVPKLGGVVTLCKHPLVIVGVIALALFLLERSFRREKQKDAQQLEDIRRQIAELTDKKEE